MAPLIVGILQSDYNSPETSLIVSTAEAIELDRVVQSDSKLSYSCIGPSSIGGSVEITDIEILSINKSSGVITISPLSVNKIAGSLVFVKNNTNMKRFFDWLDPAKDFNQTTLEKASLCQNEKIENLDEYLNVLVPKFLEFTD